MALKQTAGKRIGDDRSRLAGRLPDLLPDSVDVSHQLQERARRVRHPAEIPVFSLDGRELFRSAVALELSPVRLQFDRPLGRRQCRGAAHRRAGGLVDGLCADQAHQGPADVDALHQDDAGRRRARADLSLLSRPSLARQSPRHRLRPHDVEPADPDLDALHLLQGNPGRHPRSGAHGRRFARQRDHLCPDADGDPGNRLDHAAWRSSCRGTKPSGRSISRRRTRRR